MSGKNFLQQILPIVKKTIASGYYSKEKNARKKKRSLVQAMHKTKKTPIIAEIKPKSPSRGELICDRDAAVIIRSYISAGACAVSVLTEPEKFGGSLELLEEDYGVPLLQKDFIISEKQLSENADAVLLIASFCELARVDVNELIKKAHEKKLEVLLEVHSLEEFEKAVKTKADLIGINNRNLKTLKTSIQTTIDILACAKNKNEKLIVSESGFFARADVERVLKAGADAVLMGTSLMESRKPAEKLKELIG